MTKPKKEELKALIKAGAEKLDRYRAKKGYSVEERLAAAKQSSKPAKAVGIDWANPEKWGKDVWLKAFIQLSQEPDPEVPLWLDNPANDGSVTRHDVYETQDLGSKSRRAHAGRRLVELVHFVCKSISGVSEPSNEQLLDAIKFIREVWFPRWGEFSVKYLKKEPTFRFSPAYLLAAQEPVAKFIKSTKAKITSAKPKRSAEDWLKETGDE